MVDRSASRKSEGAFQPIYRKLVDEFRKKIRSGEYANGQMLPSERELCLLHNVSRQTIRNALKILSEQGWIASRPGKGTCIQNPPIGSHEKPESDSPGGRQIGFICSSATYLSDPKLTELLLGCNSALSQEKYSISLSVSKKDEAHQVYPVYPEWLRHGSVSGYICVSAHHELQWDLAQRGVPALSCGYIWGDADLPSVAVDFRRIYREVVLHLDRKGHRRFCSFVWKGDTRFTQEVLGGYEEGHLALQKRPDEILVERYDNTAYGLVTALRRALKKHRPTAIILQGEEHLPEVMRFLSQQEIRVPKDLFVVAIQARPNSPDASKICFFDYEPMNLARRACEKLLEIIQTGRTKPKHELYWRGKFVDPEG